MSADNVNDAIRECLDDCKGVPSPHVVAASFVSGLRRRPDWIQEEIDQRSAALAVLLPHRL